MRKIRFRVFLVSNLVSKCQKDRIAYPSDNSRAKRSVNWNRVVVVVVPLASPMIEPYYPSHRSTISSHLVRYLCTKHHLCVLGIAAPMLDCADPKRQCYHRCSMKSILLNRDWWPMRSRPVRMMWAQPWCVALNWPNPKWIDSMLHRPQSVFGHLVAISPSECSYHVAITGECRKWAFIANFRKIKSFWTYFFLSRMILNSPSNRADWLDFCYPAVRCPTLWRNPYHRCTRIWWDLKWWRRTQLHRAPAYWSDGMNVVECLVHSMHRRENGPVA